MVHRRLWAWPLVGLALAALLVLPVLDAPYWHAVAILPFAALFGLLPVLKVTGRVAPADEFGELAPYIPARPARGPPA